MGRLQDMIRDKKTIEKLKIATLDQREWVAAPSWIQILACLRTCRALGLAMKICLGRARLLDPPLDSQTCDLGPGQAHGEGGKTPPCTTDMHRSVRNITPNLSFGTLNHGNKILLMHLNKYMLGIKGKTDPTDIENFIDAVLVLLPHDRDAIKTVATYRSMRIALKLTKEPDEKTKATAFMREILNELKMLQVTPSVQSFCTWIQTSTQNFLRRETQVNQEILKKLCDDEPLYQEWKKWWEEVCNRTAATQQDNQ